MRDGCDDESDEPCNETCQAVEHDEADYGTTGGSCRPVDVPPLKTHKFKGTLQTLEKWVVWVAAVFVCTVHSSVVFSRLETEE